MQLRIFSKFIIFGSIDTFAILIKLMAFQDLEVA